MSKFLIFVALCLLPLIVRASRQLSEPLVVEGRVYCDTCRAGFFTPASTYIAGAQVRLECKSRESSQGTFSREAKTDASGTYKITVAEDRGNEVCEVVLVSSPESSCNTITPGADRARAILTTNNGLASNTRNVNALGFARQSAQSGCTQVLQAYQIYQDSD